MSGFAKDVAIIACSAAFAASGVILTKKAYNFIEASEKMLPSVSEVVENAKSTSTTIVKDVLPSAKELVKKGIKVSDKVDKASEKVITAVDARPIVGALVGLVLAAGGSLCKGRICPL